jgi:AraC-like DNA-binding protein
MDVLSDILRSLQLRGSLYFRTELGAPWGLDVPSHENVARFHVVVGGACYIAVSGRDPVRMEAGDLAIVPHGSQHCLLDRPQTGAIPVDTVLDETAFDGTTALRYGGSGSQTTLVCGHFAFDRGVMHPLLEALPTFIHLPATETKNFAWLDTALGFISHEAGSSQPGAEAIMTRISEILFIQVIRGYIQRGGEEHRVLAGLADERISKSLELIHTLPAHPWRLDDLAKRVGMSRTAFVVRFSDLMGISPIEYWTRWRVQLAREQLRASAASVADVAEAVGYQSEASFSKAFKRYYGMAPGQFRAQSFDR